MPLTITSMKIFSKFPHPGLIYGVTVPHFPKLKLSHLNTPWTSQLWHHQLFLPPPFVVTLSATQVWNRSVIIDQCQLSFPIHFWSLAKPFLQRFLYLHLPPLTWCRLTLPPWQGFHPSFPASQNILTSPCCFNRKPLEHSFPSRLYLLRILEWLPAVFHLKSQLCDLAWPAFLTYDYVTWKLCFNQIVLASWTS